MFHIVALAGRLLTIGLHNCVIIGTLLAIALNRTGASSKLAAKILSGPVMKSNCMISSITEAQNSIRSICSTNFDGSGTRKMS